MKENSIINYINEQFVELIMSKVEEAKNEDEARKILEKIEQIDLTGIYEDSINSIATDTTILLKNSMFESVMEYRHIDEEFNARLEQKWGKGFVASEAMYLMTIDYSSMYNKFVSELDMEEKEKKKFMYLAIRYIHARALQEFLEIISLMKNGFADGAFTRWRSMYELSIVSNYIYKYGETVAKTFVEASGTNDRYEWARASGIFEKEKRFISFSDIQKNCDFQSEIWKKQYDLANKTIHASP